MLYNYCAKVMKRCKYREKLVEFYTIMGNRILISRIWYWEILDGYPVLLYITSEVFERVAALIVGEEFYFRFSSFVFGFR